MRCSSFWFTVTSSATRIRSGRCRGVVAATRPPQLRRRAAGPSRLTIRQDGRAQLGVPDRFRQRAVDVQLVTSRDVARPARRRQHDDRRVVPERGLLPDAVDQHEAVHDRHLAIDEQQRRIASGRAVRQQRQCGRRHQATGRRTMPHLVSVSSRMRRFVWLSSTMRARSPDQRGHAGGQDFRVPLGRLQPGREMKRAAASLLALDPEAAAHQPDQALRDGQAETGARRTSGSSSCRPVRIRRRSAPACPQGSRCRCRAPGSAAGCRSR